MPQTVSAVPHPRPSQKLEWKPDVGLGVVSGTDSKRNASFSAVLMIVLRMTAAVGEMRSELVATKVGTRSAWTVIDAKTPIENAFQ